MFNPSPQQSRIFDSLALGSVGPNLIVDAKAGSGKTTTIVEGMPYIPQENEFMKPSVVFLAFNKSIAETLKSRCPSWVQCSTFHSLGLRALKNSCIVPRNVKVDGGKCRKLVWNAMDRDDPDTKAVMKLVSLARSFAVTPENMDKHFFSRIARLHDVDMENESKAFRVAQTVVKNASDDTSMLDFDEMLYLPVIYNAKFDQQDYIFVDEAQDTNDIQLEILSRLMKPSRIEEVVSTENPHKARAEMEGVSYLEAKARNHMDCYRQPKSSTRLIAVGDPHQAIYGFRGANSNSMTRIASRFACETLPLSVSYRCPKAVVKEAQKYIK